jgi:hypothetical protein
MVNLFFSLFKATEKEPAFTAQARRNHREDRHEQNWNVHSHDRSGLHNHGLHTAFHPPST